MKLECSVVLWVLREAWEALSWKPCFPRYHQKAFLLFFWRNMPQSSFHSLAFLKAGLFFFFFLCWSDNLNMIFVKAHLALAVPFWVSTLLRCLDSETSGALMLEGNESLGLLVHSGSLESYIQIQAGSTSFLCLQQTQFCSSD